MLVGARIVRIAVHPDFQCRILSIHFFILFLISFISFFLCLQFKYVVAMGYGTRALQLLHQYYEGSILDLDESEEPAAKKSKCSVKNVDVRIYISAFSLM